MNSVRFLGREELESLAGENMIFVDEISCGEQVVNLGLFRRHMEKWLRSREEIIVKKGRTMFVMVRQLQSTPQGIPLELYFFTNKTGWADYEEIQSEIFDYVYAIIGKFGLILFL